MAFCFVIQYIYCIFAQENNQAIFQEINKPIKQTIMEATIQSSSISINVSVNIDAMKASIQHLWFMVKGCGRMVAAAPLSQGPACDVCCGTCYREASGNCRQHTLADGHRSGNRGYILCIITHNLIYIV